MGARRRASRARHTRRCGKPNRRRRDDTPVQIRETRARGRRPLFQAQAWRTGPVLPRPLKDLEALDGNAQEGLRYTAEWGAELATIYNERVDAKAFFDAVDDDRVDAKMVRALSAYCPCHLRKNKPERDALVKLLFCRGEGHLKLEAGGERRQTLTLLLDHARALQEDQEPLSRNRPSFSTAATQVSCPTPQPGTPASLTEIRSGWGIYKRHELLAIAAQGLFWAGLSALLDEGGHVEDGPAYAKWFGKRFRGVLGTGFASTPFQNRSTHVVESLPEHSDWQSAEHEVNLGDALVVAQNDENVDEVVALLCAFCCLSSHVELTSRPTAGSSLPTGSLRLTKSISSPCKDARRTPGSR